MSIQMSFKKDNSSIKLESITDDGKTLDIAAYKDKGLLTIGTDGKYIGISAEPTTTLPSNNEMIENIEEENTETSNNLDSGSNELTTQESDLPNTEEKIPASMNLLDEACKDLELEPGCENDDKYRSAYKKLALKYHPDRCKTPECEPMMKKINAANEKLNKYNNETPRPRVSENNEATQPVNTSTLAIEKPLHQISLPENVFSFGNKSVLPSNVPVPPENNSEQLAMRNGGKTKRRKVGKKNKSKRVRFMSRRNRRR